MIVRQLRVMAGDFDKIQEEANEFLAALDEIDNDVEIETEHYFQRSLGGIEVLQLRISIFYSVEKNTPEEPPLNRKVFSTLKLRDSICESAEEALNEIHGI